MIDWLRDNKDSLSIRGIERQLKMPDSTLIKAVNGSQELPKKWIEPLKQFLNNLKRGEITWCEDKISDTDIEYSQQEQPEHKRKKRKLNPGRDFTMND